MPLLGWIECLGVSKLRPDWSIHTNTSGVLISSPGVFSKGYSRGCPWEAGESYHKGCLGGHIRNLHFLVTSSCCLGHALEGLREVEFREGTHRSLDCTKWLQSSHSME